ncbi:hypothetical protein E1B28_005771 [Marasmius oreades]|uniref:STB6-like N-terminal domain-containing protein n=1 Tax=Marasmius oreades TaxID=181124 RepID=A0A9P7S5B9_9AGAR|nr:uncharacterized protein E1B28_005771 [Marasmius oreades]KAG7094971.1 hypothetical protein E1B28_005771 [Marasmius oreades]
MLRPASQGIELNGFQLYAVQRWFLERRSRPFLVIHTGDPAHRITVVNEDSDDKPNVHARPKDTPHGTIMVTSLAHFPSDYTILLIPHGDFNDKVRDELYRNMVLQRLGLSGRSALTLQVPSDATKQRFVSAYHFPESTKSDQLFTPSVLELIRQVQAALIVFGAYDGPIDGLLCDQTTAGLRKWLQDYGGMVQGLESTTASSRTGTADSSTVSALLSLVLAVRNRLVVLSPHSQIPKDPFLHPESFIHTIRRHVSTPNDSSSFKPHHSYTYSLPSVPTISTLSGSAPSSMKATTSNLALKTSPFTPTASTFLTRNIVQSMFTTYDTKLPKMKGTYNYREQEKEKESPLAALHLGSLGATLSGSHGPQSVLFPTADLTEFLHTVVGRNRLKERERERGKGKGKEKEKESERGSFDGDDPPTSPLVNNRSRSPGSPSTPTPYNTLATSKGTKPRTHKPKSKASKDNEVTGVAGTLRGLWSGNILMVVQLRERMTEGEREREKESDGGTGERKGIWSDGDTEFSPNFDSLKRTRLPHMSRRGSLQERSDGTEDENLGNGDSLGSRWARSSERFNNVKDKFENWTGLNKIDNKLTKRKAATHHSNESTSTTNVAVVDLSPNTATPGGSFSKHNRLSVSGRLLLPFGGESGNNSTSRIVSAAQTPSELLPAFGDPDPDDDAMPSSGQASPVSDDPRTPKSFGMFAGSAGSSKAQWARALDKSSYGPLQLSSPPVKKSTSGGNESVISGSSVSSGKYTGLGLGMPGDGVRGTGVGKRPWGSGLHLTNQRVTSWSDPVSARGRPEGEVDNNDLSEESDGMLSAPLSVESEVEGGRKMRNRHKSSESMRFHLRVYSENGGFIEEQEASHEPPSIKKKVVHGPRRRRTFHSLSTFREGDIKILPLERMRIDVELAGQYLIMDRREQHLKNVMATLSVLTNRLSSTNANLWAHYKNHLPDLAALEARSKVIAELETENDRIASKINQPTNTLQYEGQQFHVEEAWRATNHLRNQVLEYRRKLFETEGGRRLMPGIHGAHGRFNRLQWTLDGRERLVDSYGRTESEAEEEDKVDLSAKFGQRVKEEDEEDAVEHPGIKPMWLLRFFTRLGAVWGRVSAAAPSTSVKVDPTSNPAVTTQVPSILSTPNSPESVAVNLPLPIPEKAQLF